MNSLDYVLCAGDAALRGTGLLGSNCLSFLHLDDRIDISRLHRAIEKLYHERPHAGARLITRRFSRRPCWRFVPDAGASDEALVVHDRLPGGARSVHEAAEHLLNQPLDPAREPPVQWHVFRSPGCADVLALRWSHVLMDAKGGELLCAEVDRLDRNSSRRHSVAGGNSDEPDLIAEQVNRFPRRVRNRLLRECLGNASSGEVPTASMATPTDPPAYGRYRFAVRTIDGEAYQRVREFAVAACGLAALSAFQAASALRALHRTIQQIGGTEGRYTTRWLLNLRSSDKPEPIFGNCFSFVPLEAGRSRIEDRNEIARQFARIIRPTLMRHVRAGGRRSRRHESDDRHDGNGCDLADVRFLLLTRAAQRLPFPLVRSHSLRARFGAVPPALPMSQIGPFAVPLETFCGRRLLNYVGAVFTIPPARGYTLQWNEFDRQLNLALVYLDGLVHERTAETYLDLLVNDLLSPE